MRLIGSVRLTPYAAQYRDDTSLRQQILDIPEAQTVSVVQPHRVADDVRRKAMPKVAGSTRMHPGIVPRGELS